MTIPPEPNPSFWRNDCEQHFKLPTGTNEEIRSYMQSFLQERIPAITSVTLDLHCNYVIHAEWATPQGLFRQEIVIEGLKLMRSVVPWMDVAAVLFWLSEAESRLSELQA